MLKFGIPDDEIVDSAIAVHEKLTMKVKKCAYFLHRKNRYNPLILKASCCCVHLRIRGRYITAPSEEIYGDVIQRAHYHLRP
jgi:hypothetical protein